MHIDRTSFLDVDFDVTAAEDLLPVIAETSRDGAYRYIVTPNVDHVVRLHKQGAAFPGLPDIYRNAFLCVCDSQVLARIARLKGVTLPVIVGTDLASLVLDRIAQSGDVLGVIGADEDTVRSLRARYPRFEFAHHSPPMGLLGNPSARKRAAEFIADRKPRFTFICVGSPQQEMIAAEAAEVSGSCGTALCVGAALEFIAGRQKRAPKLARRLGLEWAHRLVSNPRRLWRRYLVEGPAIFLLAWRWRRKTA